MAREFYIKKEDPVIGEVYGLVQDISLLRLDTNNPALHFTLVWGFITDDEFERHLALAETVLGLSEKNQSAPGTNFTEEHTVTNGKITLEFGPSEIWHMKREDTGEMLDPINDYSWTKTFTLVTILDESLEGDQVIVHYASEDVEQEAWTKFKRELRGVGNIEKQIIEFLLPFFTEEVELYILHTGDDNDNQ